MNPEIPSSANNQRDLFDETGSPTPDTVGDGDIQNASLTDLYAEYMGIHKYRTPDPNWSREELIAAIYSPDGTIAPENRESTFEELHKEFKELTGYEASAYDLGTKDKESELRSLIERMRPASQTERISLLVGLTKLQSIEETDKNKPWWQKD